MTLDELLREDNLARAHTDALTAGLTEDEISWRPVEASSAIGWHLGHQAAVAHVAVRNLVFAEPSLDPRLDRLFDSTTPETERGDLPPVASIRDYRDASADFVHRIVARVRDGAVGAPDQQARIAAVVVRAIVNHEYQHDTWIGEMREALGHAAEITPASNAVEHVDGYWILAG